MPMAPRRVIRRQGEPVAAAATRSRIGGIGRCGVLDVIDRRVDRHVPDRDTGARDTHHAEGHAVAQADVDT